MKNILLTGAQGMFGQDAAEVFTNYGYKVLKAGKAELDVTNKAQITEFFLQNKIDLIIHAAAYTKVDDAELNPTQAFLVNSEAAKYIAEISAAKKIPLVYISTDYVFDGNATSPYLPSSKTNPLNVYGASKLQGEENVKINPQHYIVRTSWLYGKSGKNFVDTMINLSKNQQTIKVVNDQFGCPTWTVDLANAIKNLIEQKMPFGIYHLCNSGVTSWFDFAKKIFEILQIKTEVIAVSSDEFERRATRPKYSAMQNDNLLRKWDEALLQYLRQK